MTIEIKPLLNIIIIFCFKVFADWQERIGNALDKTVVLLTGEPSTDLKLLQRGKLIVASPEKWDNVSRRWKQRKNVQAVKLFIVDDLHMIGASSGVSTMCSLYHLLGVAFASVLHMWH